MPLVPEGDHHDARVRPDRRDPLGRLRRDGDPGAARRRIVDCQAQGDRLLGLHLPPRQEDPAQADDRRGGPRPRLRRARRRPPARLAARRRARTTFESEREHDFYDIQERARDPLPAGADGRGGPALHPLHVRARRGRRRASSTRRAATWSASPTLARPSTRSASATSTGPPPTSAGSSATRSSSTGRSPIGATVFCREGVPDYPTPEVTWELCERFGVNVMFTAPTAVRMWMSHGPEAPAQVRPVAAAAHRLRRRAAQPGGAPLGPEAPRGPVGRDGGGQLVADRDRRARSSARCRRSRPGRARSASRCPGVDAEVVDAQGNPLPDGHGGLLVLRKPLPYMLRTVWGDHARYEKYWQQIPGCYTAGDIAVRDARRLLRRARPRRRRAERGRPPDRHGRRGGLAAPPPGRGRERRRGPARTRSRASGSRRSWC